MTTPLIEQVRKVGGVSPDKSNATSDWQELGREYRRAGFKGVICANGRGRDAEDIFVDLDPDVRADAEYLAGRETGTGGSHHVLLDALTRELHRLGRNGRGATKQSILDENADLRETIQAMECELDTLGREMWALRARYEPDADGILSLADFSPQSVRKGRESLGLTQEQAARRIGVTWITLSRWETGKTRPASPAHIRALNVLMNEAKTGTAPF